MVAEFRSRFRTLLLAFVSPLSRWTATISIVICGCAAPRADDASLEELIQKPSSTASKDIALANRALFEGASEIQLRKCRENEDLNVAIRASWELVKRTVPKRKQAHAVRPEPLALRSFIASVEQRVAPPSWWKECILAVNAWHRDNVYFIPAPAESSTGQSPISDTKLASLENEDRCYRARYSMFPIQPFKVLCLDRQTKRFGPRWFGPTIVSTIWAPDIIMSN